MPDPDDVHDEIAINDLIQNAVDPLSYPIELVPAELLGSGRTRILRERMDPCYDAHAILLWNLLELSDGRRCDQQPITCHGAAGP